MVVLSGSSLAGVRKGRKRQKPGVQTLLFSHSDLFTYAVLGVYPALPPTGSPSPPAIPAGEK